MRLEEKLDVSLVIEIYNHMINSIPTPIDETKVNEKKYQLMELSERLEGVIKVRNRHIMIDSATKQQKQKPN